MARQLRIEYPGALYHITSRGDGQENIYLSNMDMEMFLAIFATTCERYHWYCYAYCLMHNHYHLLIETPLGNLSKGMQHLNGIYTQQFNKKHQRVVLSLFALLIQIALWVLVVRRRGMEHLRRQ